jgi:hypothetical protein
MKKRVAPTPAQFAAATPEQQRFAFNLAFQNQKND